LTSEPLRHGTNKQKLTKHRPKAPLILSPGAGPQATEPPFGLGPMTPSYARGAIERHLTSRPPEFPGNSMGSQCAHWARPFGQDAGSRGTYRATARSPSGRPLRVCRRSKGPKRPRIHGLCVTSKKALARKWRPTFFLLSGAKKVGRHTSSQLKGLCLETPAPGTDKWRFWPSKKRHSPPFFPSARQLVRRFRAQAACPIDCGNARSGSA
jgi:hypothetical protein